MDRGESEQIGMIASENLMEDKCKGRQPTNAVELIPVKDNVIGNNVLPNALDTVEGIPAVVLDVPSTAEQVSVAAIFDATRGAEQNPFATTSDAAPDTAERIAVVAIAGGSSTSSEQTFVEVITNDEGAAEKSVFAAILEVPDAVEQKSIGDVVALTTEQIFIAGISDASDVAKQTLVGAIPGVSDLVEQITIKAISNAPSHDGKNSIAPTPFVVDAAKQGSAAVTPADTDATEQISIAATPDVTNSAGQLPVAATTDVSGVAEQLPVATTSNVVDAAKQNSATAAPATADAVEHISTAATSDITNSAEQLPVAATTDVSGVAEQHPVATTSNVADGVKQSAAIVVHVAEQLPSAVTPSTTDTSEQIPVVLFPNTPVAEGQFFSTATPDALSVQSNLLEQASDLSFQELSDSPQSISSWEMSPVLEQMSASEVRLVSAPQISRDTPASSHISGDQDALTDVPEQILDANDNFLDEVSSVSGQCPVTESEESTSGYRTPLCSPETSQRRFERITPPNRQLNFYSAPARPKRRRVDVINSADFYY